MTSRPLDFSSTAQKSNLRVLISFALNWLITQILKRTLERISWLKLTSANETASLKGNSYLEAWILGPDRWNVLSSQTWHLAQNLTPLGISPFLLLLWSYQRWWEILTVCLSIHCSWMLTCEILLPYVTRVHEEKKKVIINFWLVTTDFPIWARKFLVRT